MGEITWQCSLLSRRFGLIHKAHKLSALNYKLNLKQLIGFVGALLLFIGVFTPIVSVPMAGNISYLNNGKGDGVILLILSILSVVILLLKKNSWLWGTVCGSVSLLLFTFVNFHLKMSEAKASLDSQLEGNPFRSLADVAMQAVQLQWGWGVLLLGSILLIVSAAIRDALPLSDVVSPKLAKSPPKTNERSYRIAKNGVDHGELKSSEIKLFLSTGQLTENDYFLDTDKNEWITLSTWNQSV